MAHGRYQLPGVDGGGAYDNYSDPTVPNWAYAYYGDNLTRLRQVAQRYDPDRFFTFPQAIANA